MLSAETMLRITEQVIGEKIREELVMHDSFNDFLRDREQMKSWPPASESAVDSRGVLTLLLCHRSGPLV